MSGAVATAAAVAVGATVLQQALAPKAPKIPEPATPATPPQAAKVPDQQAMRAGKNEGGGVSAAPSGTMLTGASGVAPGGVNIGTNTLLGG